MLKEHTQQCEDINENTDKRVLSLDRHVSDYTRRLDRHLEIYAQNGKELKALKDRVGVMEGKVDGVYGMAEALLQQISGVGSDVKNMQIQFTKYIGTVDGLEKDKARKDDRAEWFVRTVFGILILAIMVVIGVEMK